METTSSQPPGGGAGGQAFERAILGMVGAPLQACGPGVAAQTDHANLMADCSLGTDALAERIGNHAPTARAFSATPTSRVTVAFRPGVVGRCPRLVGAK